MINQYISPNDAELGSLVYAAERWMLSLGFPVPVQSAYPHLYQGMLDDFMESDEYAEFEAST